MRIGTNAKPDYDFSDSELWSLYHTFARFIHRGLWQHRAMSGMPMSVATEIFPEKDIFSITDDDIKVASRAWNEIYDKMLYSFDVIQKSTVEEGCSMDEMELAMEMDDRCKEDPKIKEGLMLFGKHFLDLWD